MRHAGQMLAFRTRKTLGLLIYLAVAGGTHSREKLTALFWPESSEEQGRASLRNTLLYLRHALQENSDASHLIIGRDALGFNFDSAFELDIHTLQTAFKQTSSHTGMEALQDDICRSQLSHFQAAIKQYRSDFLQGFSLDDAPDFDDWVRLQRETWHHYMSAILARLSQLYFDRGETVAATETTRCWLAHDPLDEAVYQRLMQVHVAAGNRHAALHIYELCQTMLAKELRALPMPETKALAERIRASIPQKHTSPSTSNTVQTVPHLSTLPGLPLIGRGTEYGRLIKCYRAAALGQAQIVLLTGEAGIGKTRLASEFLGWAVAHEADVLRGRAFEIGGQLPYQALVDALRGRIERENAPDDLLSDTWLAELSRLLPELRDRYPDLPTPAYDEAAARIRLFEAVVRLFQALAKREPIVLFIDDVHWADAASLDILHYAARRWQQSHTPLLLLLGLRTGNIASNPIFARWSTSAEDHLHTTCLTLGRLSREDTAQLVQALEQADSASQHSEQFARWLFDETHGQPFYILEMLKALRERDLLTPHLDVDGKWRLDLRAAASAEDSMRGLLPPSMREVIRSRFTQLSSTALTLLAAGAVLGRAFTFEQVCLVAGIEENAALLALDELLGSQHLAESTGNQHDAYFFTHDKIRDVAYTEAGEARRRVFHRRALDVLEAVTAPPAELAHHARAAGLGEPALRLSTAAGDADLQLFATRDAITHYEQARRMLTEQPGRYNLSSSSREHLYIQLGRAYELNSEFEQAQAVYQEMLAFARAAGIASIECSALNHLATLAAQNPYDYERTMQLLHQALHAASQSRDPALLAETEWNLAQFHVYHFNPTQVLQHGERALAFSRQLDSQEAENRPSNSTVQTSHVSREKKEELMARSLNVIAYAQMGAGRWEESATRAEEARTLYASLGNRAMEADSLCLIAINSINSGRLQAGINTARTAYAISTKIENAWGQVNSALALGQGLLETGMYSQAIALAELAVKLARTNNMTILLYLSLILLGSIQRATHAAEPARAAHLEALNMAAPSGVPLLTEVVAAELCADCAVKGEREEAHSYALKALSERTDTFLLSTKLNLWHQTEALARMGDIERASQDVQRYSQCIGNSPRYRIPYLRALAILAQYRGETDKAIEHTQKAVMLAQEIGLLGEQWPLQAAPGDLYLTQNKTDHTCATFKQAATIIHKLANTLESREQRANFLALSQIQRILAYATLPYDA
ncbi:MAG: hypothetical protein PVS3B1_23950 [Ktedonobacteraceae bacterium]